jgi:hypothetical protein
MAALSLRGENRRGNPLHCHCEEYNDAAIQPTIMAALSLRGENRRGNPHHCHGQEQ